MVTNPDDYTGISSPAGSDGHKNVSALKEQEVWEDEIYQIEKNDLLTGGEKGLANLQAQQLANRTAWLKKNAGNNAQFKQLQHIVNNLMMSAQITSLDPQGYDGMIVENFNEKDTEIDQSVFDIVSIDEDKQHLIISGSNAPIVGGCYQIGDGVHHEEIQLKSVASNTGTYNITLKNKLSNDYKASDAKIARTSMNIDIGRAYGGEIRKTESLTDLPFSLQQKDRPEMSVKIPFQNPRLFDLKDAAATDKGELLPLSASGGAVGLVLEQAGNFAGVWKLTDAYGNDLMQVLDKKDKLEPLPKSYGMVLDQSGNFGSVWKRVDEHGNDMLDELYPELMKDDPDGAGTGLVLSSAGNTGGTWIRINEKTGEVIS